MIPSMKRLGAPVAAVFTLVAGLLLAVPTAAHAGTNVGGIEAEMLASEQGGGALVYADSTASAGKALELTDAVTVKGTISTTAAADSFWITAHTDANSGTAYLSLKVDGVTVASNAGVAVSTWGAYKFTGSWAAGSHTVEVAFTNPAALNLYLDRANFATSQTSTPTSTVTAAAPSTETGQLVTSLYTTGYGYWDNTPAGSVTISNPVIHSTAGGTGTWSNPVTVAVGHSLATGSDVLDYPAGTKFYVPSVQKYFIAEDTCGDGSAPQNIGCHKLFGTANGNDAPQGATKWIDLWVGGNASTSASITDSCEALLTDIHTVVVNPSVQNYKVDPGDISQSTCHAGYGENLLYQ